MSFYCDPQFAKSFVNKLLTLTGFILAWIALDWIGRRLTMTIAMVGGAAALLCFAAVDAFAEKTENGFSFWFNLVSWP